jgi:hypothetical protein
MLATRHRFARALLSYCGCRSAPVACFIGSLFRMLEDDGNDHLIAWSASGDTFLVKNVEVFAAELLPQYFKHSNFSSLSRQLCFCEYATLGSAGCWCRLPTAAVCRPRPLALLPSLRPVVCVQTSESQGRAPLPLQVLAGRRAIHVAAVQPQHRRLECV